LKKDENSDPLSQIQIAKIFLASSIPILSNRFLIALHTEDGLPFSINKPN
jgi:hypothetical protein